MAVQSVAVQSVAVQSVAVQSVAARLDVLVLGSGVAGLSAGLAAMASSGARVGVLTKAPLDCTATRWAQGGVAVALGEPGSGSDGGPDSTDLHLADTLSAGAGLCDPDAVRILVDQGPPRLEELIAMGAIFDRVPGGGLSRAREGGHSTARVIHANGAATGAEIERALVDALRTSPGMVMEGWFALDLVVEQGRCRGVTAIDSEGRRVEVRADHVVLATGGAGQLFAVTTNPAEATGDGLAMALRAGVAVADVEFIQFHPTALHPTAASNQKSSPRPLLSEALRGHGAVLRDNRGRRFVDELSPRDAVSRAMASRMAEEGTEHLWLDATGLEGFARRFPTIAASLAAAGLDPAVDRLPIAPAAHHVSGGVLTDLDGATTLPGLWACGEAACTGAHGANRLASNSLLEGLVFGARVAEALAAGRLGPSPTGAMRAVLEGGGPVPGRVVGGASAGGEGMVRREGMAGGTAARRATVQAAMTEGAGVLRDAASLARAEAVVARAGLPGGGRAGRELDNLVTVAQAVLASARARTESRGAHTRTDWPRADPALRLRLVHRR